MSVVHTLSKVTAPLARPLAGHRLIKLWALVEHRGRTSGRIYRTPVAVVRTADGFMIPVPFGDRTQWVKNVLAAGGCRLRWAGHDLELVAPVVLEGAPGAAAFNRLERAILDRVGIDHFLRLDRLQPETGRAANLSVA
jgi:deazaflavin-dependent oxidoreductase (nitroreductase family)